MTRKPRLWLRLFIVLLLIAAMAGALGYQKYLQIQQQIAQGSQLPPPISVTVANAEPAGPRTDVISALVNLGYPEGPASRAVDQVVGSVAAEPPGFEELLRQSLQRLHRK